MAARTAADGKWVRRTACADGCGVGARELAGNGWGEEAAGDEASLAARTAADGQMGAEKCADGCGWRGCKGVAGNGWGEEAAGDERAWLR